MATVWDHLSVEELEERFVGCEDVHRNEGVANRIGPKPCVAIREG